MRTLSTTFVLIALLFTADGAASGQTKIAFSTDQVNVAEGQVAATAEDFSHTGSIQFAAIDTEFGVPVVQVNGNTYSVEAGADQIITADFNHDGNLDLAVANRHAHSISLLTGNGDGSFTGVQALRLPAAPLAITAADFNHDGFADLAAFVCSATCTLQTFRSDASARFTLMQSIPVNGSAPSLPGLMATADFDRNGRPDIALISDKRRVRTYLTGSDSVLRFQSEYALPSGTIATALTTGAFDQAGAGSVDVAVRVIESCASSCAFRNGAYVLLNDGLGRFTLSSHIALAPSSSGGLLSSGDINGDGRQDLIALASDPLKPVFEYALGNGAGQFSARVQVLLAPHAANAPAVTNQPTSMLVRDLNRDSRLDVMYSGYDALGDDLAGVFEFINRNAVVNCAPPSTAKLSARICAPFGNSVSVSPVTISAAGDSPAGVKRLELWIDHQKRGEVWSNQLRQTLPLAVGTHRVVVVAIDQDDSFANSAAVQIQLK